MSTPWPTFDRDYTVAQLHRGDGMLFHPYTGDRLETLIFAKKGKRFHRRIVGPVTGWCFYEDVTTFIPLERIGRCGCKCAGDVYPLDWLFDPFTGEFLSLVQKGLSNGRSNVCEAHSAGEC